MNYTKGVSPSNTIHIKRMMANEKLTRAISGVGFGIFRWQMEYKAKHCRTHLLIAGRWRTGSPVFGVWLENKALMLQDQYWTCPHCGTHYDRDINAARNLKRLATETALPVASPTGNGGAASGMVPGVVGEVTPVRDEFGQQDGSGQEVNGAHFGARF
ncbi:zinc ribbon domain-containing protein [Thiorhodospira sibirica]|uniref:zinc ribbon domain-containing protein n=1 Tax=Thiorhodospira sibirica TaxID=154347 RepID=UPI001111BB1C|nr:zinc ribbon domain-containing protein [Thiorhodospira sibirica]